MHVRIIHQYFRLPGEGGSLRSYYLAKALIDKGFEVSIITATNNKNAHSSNYEGINIHYVPVYYSNHLGFYSRIHAFLRFVFASIRKISQLSHADFHYVISTPLTTGFVGLYGKSRHNIPYIFEAGDLWPAAPIALKVLKNPLLIRLAEWMEALFYKNAALLVGLSPPITKAMLSVSPGNPAITITNFSNISGFGAESVDENWREVNEIPEENLLIAYAGTIGMANHLQYLVDLASAIPPEWPVSIVIMGEGAQMNHVKSYSESLKLNNIKFLNKGNMEQVAALLSASDLCYISFYKAEVLNTGCPNKFFDALAAGKPVIINFEGWLKDIIEKHGIGYSYDPEHPHEGVKKLRHFIEDPDFLKSSSLKARELALRYVAEIQTEPLVKFLEGKEPA